MSGTPTSWPRVRPTSEVSAIELLTSLARVTGCRTHVLHLSSAEAVGPLARSGVTAETCPHYLTLAAEQVGPGATEFKCCPPIRGDANRERLWEALRDGTIGMVVSDHSPATADLKTTGDFGTAWGGIASLQLGPAAGVDGGQTPRVRPGRRRALDVLAAGRARRAGHQGSHRGGTGRGSRRLRAGRTVHRRPGTAAPSPPGHAVRGAGPHRRGAIDVAARPTRRRPSPTAT